MKTKLVVIVGLVATLLLSACGVPQSKMDEANAEVNQLTADLATANTKLSGLEEENAELKGELDSAQDKLTSTTRSLNAAENTLSQFDSLFCEQDWQFAAYEAWGIQPLSNFPDVPEELMPYLFVTQWNLDGPISPDEPYSVLLFDVDNKQSMAVDSVNDCIIVNPSIFPFGK